MLQKVYMHSAWGSHYETITCFHVQIHHSDIIIISRWITNVLSIITSDTCQLAIYILIHTFPFYKVTESLLHLIRILSRILRRKLDSYNIMHYICIAIKQHMDVKLYIKSVLRIHFLDAYSYLVRLFGVPPPFKNTLFGIELDSDRENLHTFT